MCGIVGRLNLSDSSPIEPVMLHAMLGAIRHRGPDQFGTYLFDDGNCRAALGSARLSIIDLAGGQQPLSNEEGTIWIVFNGEIFNYVELRPQLERLGHRFGTNSDTEIIVHLYEQYGPDCVTYLNGQFAFAIWDERDRTLFIGRDRVGVRPVFYTTQGGALRFASEIKALLAGGDVRAELDPVTIDQIFTFWSPLSPRTAFKEIKSLPPGHWMLARPSGEIRIEPYWVLAFPATQAREHTSRAELDARAFELRELLVDATRIRLRSDVPVGAYLSGGLDSSAITALIQHYTGNRLETFSVAFSDAEFDESEFQTQMADHLGTYHHQITCTHEQIGQLFPEVIWHTEVPILRTSPVPLYMLSGLVRDSGFKVVLTGEGADEFLGGYNIFKEASVRRFWARQANSEIRPRLLSRLYGYIGGLSSGNDAYRRAYFGQGLQEVDSPYYSHALRWKGTSRGKRLFSEAMRGTLAASARSLPEDVPLPSEFDSWGPLARAQYLEITIFLSEYLLSSQGDRVGMGHSIEGRFPFLDHRVIEFANQLPASFKLRGLTEKYILKQAVRDLLPEAIWRRAKRPYRAPIHRSFFPDGRALEWVDEILAPPSIEEAGIFDARSVGALRRKIEQTSALGEHDDMTLAALLSTQLLYQQFIAGFQPPSPLTKRDDIKAIHRSEQNVSTSQVVPSTQIWGQST